MTDPSGPRALPDVIAGRYKVVEQLGAGGMGLVYKAIDTRLDRAVAIKAIHDRRLLQADAAKRLRAEALAAASLDHPYICKVYELIEEADETLLVMELVEGETLTSLLRRGPPPLAQTLQLGREIAEGLAAAHARGLVHRDIKPSNVIVTPHGHVKLLDFGLARIGTTTHAGQDTRTPPAATNPYAGTPFYMAPEQAAGQPITSRADLFSLGVVMFECLSGKLPFEGGAGYDYVRHLLSDHPRQLYRLAPEAPADLVQLVERCLEKTPAARPESAAEVVATLQRLSDSLTRSAVDVRTVSDVRRRRRRSWIGIAAGLAVVAAAAATYLLQPADPTSVLRASRPFVSWPSEEFESRISPDGQWVSFLSARGGAIELFVQRVDGGEPRAVTLAAGKPLSQIWSPDGREIACAIVQGQRIVLHVVPAFFGGAPRVQIALNVPAPQLRARLLRWIDRAIYVQVAEPVQGLDRVDLASGAVTSMTASWKLDGTLQSVDVRPDGKAVVYVLTQNGHDDLWVADVDGANARRLTNDTFFERWPLWRGQGATILFRSNRGGQIDLFEIDPRTSRIWALTSSQTQEQPESTSADGRLISFQQSSDDEKVWVVDVASGKSRQLTAGTLSDSAPAWSADGTHLVFQRAQASPTQSALMVDTRLNVAELRDGAIRNEPRALGDGFNALISPDGSAIAYQQLHGRSPLARLVVTELATGNAAIVSEDSTLPTISLFPLEFVEQVFAWNAAGTEIYYADYGDRRTVRRRRANASEPPDVLATIEPEAYIRDIYPSPDGRWLAYVVWKTKSATVRLIDLQTGASRDLAAFPESNVYVRGWLAGDAGLLAVRRAASEDEIGVFEIELLTVSHAGTIQTAGVIDHAFAGTVRLDASRAMVYLTRSVGGIHNVHAYSLATRTLRQLTDNDVPGVAFSGVRFGPPGAGSVVLTRTARVRDVWLSEIGPAGARGR